MWVYNIKTKCTQLLVLLKGCLLTSRVSLSVLKIIEVADQNNSLTITTVYSWIVISYQIVFWQNHK